MKSWAVILLLLGAILSYSWCPANGQGVNPSNNHCYHNQYTGYSDCETTQSLHQHFLIKKLTDAISSQKSQTDAEKNSQEDLTAQKQMAFSALWMLYFSALALAVTVIGTVLVGFTVVFTYKANKSAIRAAEAAENTLEAYKDTSQRELRAYVGLLSAKCSEIKEGMDGIKFTASLQNFGSTPAHDFTHIASIYAAEKGKPHVRILLPPFPGADSFSKCSVHPGMVINAEPTNRLTTDDIIGILNDTHTLYLQGSASYRDIFDEAQSIDYKYRYVEGGLVPCHEGNKAT